MEDQELLFAANFSERCKLISLGGRNTFNHKETQIIIKWSEHNKDQFSLSCLVGNLRNCCLESDDDIVNIFYLCNSSMSNLVIMDLFFVT